MTIEQDIGKRIVSIRKLAKLSQEDLAGLAELDRSYLSEVENGHRKISVEILIKIADALKVKTSFLLGE